LKALRYLPFQVLLLMCISVSVVYAADCPSIVKNALDATSEACGTTGRNQACYGNVNLIAEAAADAPAFSFTQPGDLVEIAGVKNFVLSPLDTANDTWGVALIKIQANLPETLPGQNVTLILFGDVEITNAAVEEQTPLQAFYFKSGLNDAPCEQAPSSGILIQTPEGQGRIELTVDDVEITLGSSAYFQAQPDGELVISVVEGEGTVTADGVTVTVPAGSRARVPLDANLSAAGAPIGPEPYDGAALAALPLSLLPETITIAPAVESTADAGSASGAIIPQAGLWDVETGTLEAGAGCPPGVEQVLEPNILVFPFYVNVGDTSLMNALSVFMAAFQGDNTITQPDPNTYVIDATIQNGTIHQEYHLLSESRLEGQVVMTVDIRGSCTLTSTFTMQSP